MDFPADQSSLHPFKALTASLRKTSGTCLAWAPAELQTAPAVQASTLCCNGTLDTLHLWKEFTLHLRFNPQLLKTPKFQPMVMSLLRKLSSFSPRISEGADSMAFIWSLSMSSSCNGDLFPNVSTARALVNSMPSSTNSCASPQRPSFTFSSAALWHASDR